jgi:DNA-binding GntR family transcriptional regulator
MPATPAAQGPSRPGRKGELHGNAVSALREMIISGELAPGARLKEVELGVALGVSRTPLREALKVLASESLVDLLPNRSAIVSGLDIASCEALYEVVIALEELASRLACPRITAAEIKRITQLHQRMAAHQASGEMAEYFEANQQIHAAIVHASGNPVLVETWARLRHRVRRARYLSNAIQDSRWPQAVREHEEMLTALTARDADRLASLIRPHFMNGLAVIKAAYARAEANSAT